MSVALPPGFGPLHQVTQTGSTNADLLAADGPSGEVLVAGHQTSGRGRFDRAWEEPPGSSLLFSVRLRPAFTPAGRPWLALLGGLAIAAAAGSRVPGVALKWPNDVLVGEAKLAGVLVEARGDVVVIGAGCNVTQTGDELPVPTATSLAASGATDLDLDTLLGDVLTELARRYEALAAADGDAVRSGLHAEYVSRCATLRRQVTVELPGGALSGRATGIDPSGALLLDTGTGTGIRTLHAGDVTHLRAAP